ncbi:MAG TPA: hypothetical protein VD884_19500 [Ohtaekwangia sp.]|nr:hypothetical protein [Ohtaekwangia sp.]
MKGYIGDCEVTVSMSSDGKHIYSSDRKSLKIWDSSTNQVIDEISPFPYDLGNQSNNPDMVNVVDFASQVPGQIIFPFSLSKRNVEVSKELNDPKVKEILAKDGETYVGKKFVIPELSLVFYESKKSRQLKRIDLRDNYKVTALNSKYASPVHVPGTKVVLFERKLNSGLGALSILDAENNTWKETSDYFNFTVRAGGKIDERHIALLNRRRVYILDSESGTIVFDKQIPSEGNNLQVLFKPDRSGFYLFAEATKRIISPVFEFSYPELKIVTEIEVTRHKKPEGTVVSMFNPTDESIFYKKDTYTATHKELNVFDLRTGVEKGVFSLEEKQKFNSEDEILANKDLRMHVGNKALEALRDLPESVQPCHSCDGEYKSFSYIDDYTIDGKVIIRDADGVGGRCIVWKFPEGTPKMLYFSSTYFGDKPAENAAHVPALILNSMISSSGNEVGFNTVNGVYIYRGNTLIYEGNDKALKAMLNGKALICTPEEDKNKALILHPKDRKCLKFEIIDLATGKPLRSAAIDSFVGKSEDGNQIFISFAKSQVPELKMIDLKNPAVIITVQGNDIKETGFAYKTAVEGSPSILDRLSGQTEFIPDFRIPKIQGQFDNRYVIRNNYILTFEKGNGFTIVDIEKGKPITKMPLYSGWTQFKDMAYLKSIGKLLVIDNQPKYTGPNPGDEDPGASAFTIDVATAEIKPYLTSIDRKNYVISQKAKAAALAYSYTPEGRCASLSHSHNAGRAVFDPKTIKQVGIVMGYDCDEDVYAVAYREVIDQNAGIYQIRFIQKTRDELRLNYNLSETTSYRVCPSCNGYPMSFSKKTTSGWSDWEQKSLNIYVYRREWETKTTTVRHLCKVCKGAAWLK